MPFSYYVKGNRTFSMRTYLFNKKDNCNANDLKSLRAFGQYMDNHVLHKADTIIDLHERGFCNDFEIQEEKLFWIQEKVFIAHSDYSIVECYQFGYNRSKEAGTVILGVLIISQNVKGIIINHYPVTSFAEDNIISC